MYKTIDEMTPKEKELKQIVWKAIEIVLPHLCDKWLTVYNRILTRDEEDISKLMKQARKKFEDLIVTTQPTPYPSYSPKNIRQFYIVQDFKILWRYNVFVSDAEIEMRNTKIENCHDIIQLPENYKKYDKRQDNLIGHEAGHWIHDFINPLGFFHTASFPPNYENWTETVAVYAEALYVTNGKIKTDFEPLNPYLTFLSILPQRREFSKYFQREGDIYDIIKLESEAKPLRLLINQYLGD